MSERHGHIPEDDGPVPLFSVEAEMSVLGACLLSERALADAVERLAASKFHRPGHRTVMAAMAAIFAMRRPLDMVTLEEELKARGELERVGGPDYLLEIDLFVPSAANSEAYVDIVLEKAARREAIRAFEEGRAAAIRGIELKAVEEIALGIPARIATGRDASVDGDVKGAILRMEPGEQRAVRGVSTGNAELDALVPQRGLARKQTAIVTVGTGKGKSTHMLGMMFAGLERGERWAYLSFADLDLDEIVRRGTRWLCGVEDYEFCRSPEETAAVKASRDHIYTNWDVVVFDAESSEGANDFETARAWLLRKHDERAVDAACWDYFQKIQTSAPSLQRASMYEKLASVSNRLRILASRTGMAFAIAAQLTVEKDGREVVKDCKALSDDTALWLRVFDDRLSIRKRRFGGETDIEPAHKYHAKRWTHVPDGGSWLGRFEVGA